MYFHFINHIINVLTYSPKVSNCSELIFAAIDDSYPIVAHLVNRIIVLALRRSIPVILKHNTIINKLK